MIGYHTREFLNSPRKVSAGAIGGKFDLDTVNRLVDQFFTVEATASGNLVFKDRKGLRVNLYVTVDPHMTTAGKAFLAEISAAEKANSARRKALEEELEALLDGITTEEAILRLKGK